MGSRPAAALRAGDPPLIARTLDDRVVLDLRTVDAADDDLVANAFTSIVAR